MVSDDEFKVEEVNEKVTRKNEVQGPQPGDKVRVTGVGYENPDGSGAQTTYKTNYEVTLLDEVKGAKYPYHVEYRGNKRYFKEIHK